MDTLRLIITIIQLLSCLSITIIVMLQSGKRSGISGSISGAADSFMTRTKAKTWDARLAKMTKWFALAYVLLTLSLNLMS
jgi:preprotein translocase subunit SecG